MSLWIDGFDFYNDAGGTEMASLYESAGGTRSAVGDGVYSYGRSHAVASTAVTYAFGGNWGTVYLAFHWKTKTVQGSDTVRWIQLDDSATEQCSLRIDSSGYLKVYQGSTLKATSASPVFTSQNTWYWVAMKFVVHNSTGSILVYVNGTEVFNASSLDLTGTANAYATKVHFRRSAADAAAEGSLDNLHIYDGSDGSPYDAILAEHRIYYGLPDGDGVATDWTASSGSDYACVDENPPNEDTDYISSATVGHRNSFTVPDFDGDLVIHALSLTMQARKDDATTRGIKGYSLISGTRYYSSEFSMGATYVLHTAQWIKSPASSADWTPTEINAAEWGVEVTT